MTEARGSPDQSAQPEWTQTEFHIPIKLVTDPTILFEALCKAQPAIIEPLSRCIAISGGARFRPAEKRLFVATVFRLVQDELRGRAGTYIHGRNRRELKDAQLLAWAIYADAATKAVARHLYFEETRNAPLTVCFGTMGRPLHDSRLRAGGIERRGFPYGDGCGLVFHDSKSLPLRPYCPKCSKPGHERIRQQQAESVVRALIDGRAPYALFEPETGEPVLDETGQHLQAFGGECVVCGAFFLHSQPNALRCEWCRRGHRSRRH